MRIAKQRCSRVLHRIRRQLFISLFPSGIRDKSLHVEYLDRTFMARFQFDGVKWVPLLDSSSS